MWVSGRYDLLVEVVFDDEDGLAMFMNAYCYSDAGIASAEIMTGIKMFKNQFLLKRDFPDMPLEDVRAAPDAAE
jgi:Lrp/AsnC family transcriptional regulator, regulator for asnA, asnC and gidA